jgi:short-subunit dehydrogenase
VAPIPSTVIITGASSGIGKALALRYACSGSVLGLMSRNGDRLNDVAEQCRRLGATVDAASLDVRARADMKHWLQTFDTRTPINILIANAGVMAGRTTNSNLESSTASYALMETNVLGVLNSVQPILPRMMARGRGQIGIVSSLAAFVPLADSPTYCASKSAVLSYGLALRSLLRQSGIGVSVICPGYVMTPMMQQETGPKPFAISADAAADIIVRGLQRDRSIIAFPVLFALIARLGGLLPDNVRRWTMPRFTVGTRIDSDA